MWNATPNIKILVWGTLWGTKGQWIYFASFQLTPEIIDKDDNRAIVIVSRTWIAPDTGVQTAGLPLLPHILSIVTPRIIFFYP